MNGQLCQICFDFYSIIKGEHGGGTEKANQRMPKVSNLFGSSGLGELWSFLKSESRQKVVHSERIRAQTAKNIS